MKYKIQKLIGAVLLFLVGLWINVYFSTALHFLFSGEFERLKIIEMNMGVQSILESKQHQQLFILIQMLLILLIGVLLFIDFNPHHSTLIEVTPYIKTPRCVGQNQHGSARWMTEAEKKKKFEQVTLTKRQLYDPTFAIKDAGFIVNYKKKWRKEIITYINEDTHLLCIGSTRSGKTRSFVIQSLVLLGLAGKIPVVTDPKGELFHYTSAFFKKKGYEVITLDFRNPLKSSRFNFLQPIIDAVDENDINKAIEATWDLTSALVPDESHNEKIWKDGEASIIAAAIMIVVYDNKKKENKKYQNLTNVYCFISNMCQTNNRKMPIMEYMKTIEKRHPARMLLDVNNIAPVKTRSSFYTSALMTIRLFTSPLIWSMTNQSDFSLDTLGSKKQIIYIILPDEKSTYYSIASLFVNQAYAALVHNADARGGRLKYDVVFELDEFGNFTKIPDFVNKLTVGGGRGIRFALYLQGLDQLEEKYGKELSSVIRGNCDTWIYLKSKDPNTKEIMSKQLGDYTTGTYSISGLTKNQAISQTVNLTKRALLTTDEIGLLRRPHALVMSSDHPAIMNLPDLSKWYFNKLLGMGNKKHNIELRKRIEEQREVRDKHVEIETWDVWDYYMRKSQYVHPDEKDDLYMKILQEE